MKILEQAKKKKESIRFDDGVGEGYLPLRKRRGEASDSALWD